MNSLTLTRAEAISKLRELQDLKLISFELDEETFDIKFAREISSRLLEVSEAVYNKLSKAYELEMDLLKYTYLIMRHGAIPANKVLSNFAASGRLQTFLKDYKWSNQRELRDLVTPKVVNEILDPLRGTPQCQDDIQKMFHHLLFKNKDKFLKKEIEQCNLDGGPVAIEYVRISMVRTLLGQPPKKISLFDLDTLSTGTDCKKMDLDLLLEMAGTVLTSYLLTFKL
jgi:hypothetical protein